MNNINVKKMGLAVGLTGVSFYAGCVILMAIAGSGASINFFSSLFHGINVLPAIRNHVPLWKEGLGIVQTFILFWLIGACTAGFYNWLSPKKKQSIY